jgi:hypothetical protein
MCRDGGDPMLDLRLSKVHSDILEEAISDVSSICWIAYTLDDLDKTDLANELLVIGFEDAIILLSRLGFINLEVGTQILSKVDFAQAKFQGENIRPLVQQFISEISTENLTPNAIFPTTLGGRYFIENMLDYASSEIVVPLLCGEAFTLREAGEVVRSAARLRGLPQHLADEYFFLSLDAIVGSWIGQVTLQIDGHKHTFRALNPHNSGDMLALLRGAADMDAVMRNSSISLTRYGKRFVSVFD